MTTFACYVRVSTVGQNEAGQRASIEQWLKGNGVDANQVQWFVDKGKTGDNLKRPAFEKLQAALFNGSVKTVVVYKLDRLSRKLRDGINTLCDWIDKGIRVVATTQLIDFNGTVGKIIATVLLGIAEMEQETRRERQHDGIQEARKEGKYKGRKPGTLKADPKRVLSLHKQGIKAVEIARMMGISRNCVFVYLRKLKGGKK